MATLAYLTKLYDCATSNGTFVQFADIKEISTFPRAEGPEVDVTPLSPATAYRSFLIGLLNAGVLDFKQYYDEDEYSRWEALLRTQRFYRVTFPDGAKIEFSGLLKSFGMDPHGNPDDPQTHSGSIKLTGGATFTGVA
jgi:hypothetical protein